MSDTDTTQEAVESEEPVEDSTEDEAAGQTQDESEEQSTDEVDDTEESEEEDQDEGEDESKLDHESALKALAKVRKSEAKYRTRLREAEEKLENAKTPEEVQAVIDDIKAASATDARELLAENVALKTGLPSEFADRLKGETREELEADAKKLLKLVPAPPSDDPDLSGGLEPGGDDDSVFDVEAARKAARAMRNRPY